MKQLDSDLKQLILNNDKHSYRGRLGRLKFLLSIEYQKPFPLSMLAHEYYEEMRLCWYVGSFIATIIMAQLSFEEQFRSHYRVAKGVGGKLNSGKKVDSANFYDLIKQAKNDYWISEKEAMKLHKLRKNIRNPYVHTRDVKLNDKRKLDFNGHNFIKQYFKIRAPGLAGDDVEVEAKKTVQLAVTLLPEISLRHGGQ